MEPKKAENGSITFDFKTYKSGPALEEDEQYKILQEFRNHFDNDQDHHLQNMENELCKIQKEIEADYTAEVKRLADKGLDELPARTPQLRNHIDSYFTTLMNSIDRVSSKMDLVKKSWPDDNNKPTKRSDIPAEKDPQYVKIKKIRRSIRKISNLLSMAISEMKLIKCKHN